jgi:hypothetical protein
VARVLSLLHDDARAYGAALRVCRLWRRVARNGSAPFWRTLSAARFEGLHHYCGGAAGAGSGNDRTPRAFCACQAVRALRLGARALRCVDLSFMAPCEGACLPPHELGCDEHQAALAAAGAAVVAQKRVPSDFSIHASAASYAEHRRAPAPVVMQLCALLAAGGGGALHELHAQGCGLRDMDAKALAAALRGNSSLTRLFLQDNRIGDGCASALADALGWEGGNCTLRCLSLSGNRALMDHGARALHASLRRSASLRDVFVTAPARRARRWSCLAWRQRSGVRLSTSLAGWTTTPNRTTQRTTTESCTAKGSCGKTSM